MDVGIRDWLPDAGALERGLAEGWITQEEIAPPAEVTPVQPPPGPTTTQILADDRGAIRRTR